MVYESDFYTTRRPYSRPSPTITSYSVTAPPAHYHLPYVAVKRLTLPQSAPPRSKVRNSVLMAEIDRINHRVRPALGFSAVEHYLNSRLALSRKYGKKRGHMSLRSDVDEENFDSCRQAINAMREKVERKEIPLSAMAQYDFFRLRLYFDLMNFDDETRMIRAQTAALLKSVHTPLPRSRPLVLPTPSALMETAIPNRITSDAYIHGLLMPLSKVHTDVASRSFYVENPKPYIGKGHLACVSFAGGKAYAKRRSHLDEEPIHNRNVKNDIETLSFYSRARAVAKGEEPGPEPKAAPRKARVYRPNTDATPAPRPRPAAAAAPAPARQESVKEAAPPPAKAPEPAPAPEPAAEPVTNGINGVEEDAELARLAEEEAELARMEAELAAKESKKKKPKKQASEDADAKAAEEAAKKAAEEAAQKAAEEAAEAARRAEEEEKARKEAELEAELERQVLAELAAEEEKKKKEAELEAELERQVAAELAAEEEAKKKAEEEAEIERQVAAELAAEEAKKKEAELEAEIERQVAAELAAEEERKQAEAEPEVSNQDESEPEPEPEPQVEREPEPELDDEPAEVENEVEKKSEGEPEPLSEAGDDEPVVDEPLSQAEQDKSVNFWDADDDAAKVDEVDPLPED